MSAFRFRKLYADLVTEDGTVCVAYVAGLHAWGLEKLFAGVEIYWPDGRREVLHAGASRDVCRVENGVLHLSFDVPGGPLEVELRAEHGGWVPSGHPPCAGLAWHVLAARASASMGWATDASRPRLHGVGYSDWVEIARPIRRLGLEALHWGRIHRGAETIVYDTLEVAGRTWKRAARWHDAQLVEATPEAIVVEASDARTRLHLGKEDVTLETARTLHVGDAIDEERFPGRIGRMASRWMTGQAVERRALSVVEGGWALHEAVHFGLPS